MQQNDNTPTVGAEIRYRMTALCLTHPTDHTECLPCLLPAPPVHDNDWVGQAQQMVGLGSWRLDVATGLCEWSAPMFSLLGLDPAAGVPSLTAVFDCLCPREARRAKTALRRAIADAVPIALDICLQDAKSKEHWCQCLGHPVIDEAGQTVQMVGVLQDITERKLLERQQAALCAQTRHLLTTALERADCDPLTGLLNHRVFHRRLQEEAARAQRDGQSLAIALLDVSNFKHFNGAYGHLAGDQVLRQAGQALQNICRSYDTIARFGGDEFAVLLPGAAPADKDATRKRLVSVAEQMRFYPSAEGATLPFSLSVGLAFFPADALSPAEVLALAEEDLQRCKTGGGDAAEDAAALCHQLAVTKTGFSTLYALVTAVDNKDRYTRRHSEDVMAYCLQIARSLGLSPAEQQTIAVAALLHDVGKIGVPDAILRKPSTLTNLEFETMREHPMMSSILVGAVLGFEDMLDAVRHHHERWDGAGYPFGLSGEDTPLQARVMAVADAFSAMTTDRPYRQGMAHGKAIAILQAGAGTQWDPACVEAFVQSATFRQS